MGEIMVKIKAAPIIIGIILAVILAILFKMIAGVWGEYAGLLLATIYVGYSVGGEYTSGIIYGAIVGIIGEIMVGILATIGFKVVLGAVVLLDTITQIIIWAIIGAIGGIIGVLIKESDLSEEKPAV